MLPRWCGITALSYPPKKKRRHSFLFEMIHSPSKKNTPVKKNQRHNANVPLTDKYIRTGLDRWSGHWSYSRHSYMPGTCDTH